MSDENYSVLSYIGRREKNAKIIIVITFLIRGAPWVLKIEGNKISPIFFKNKQFWRNFCHILTQIYYWESFSPVLKS
jgi:hypothetical protein